MTKTFNIYCDESTHLQNDHKPYMLISYISTAINQLHIHNQYIKELKIKHHHVGEIKWVSVSKSQYQFFSELLEYFFATDLKFRAIIVDKSKLKFSEPDETYEILYWKMYYQLLCHKIVKEDTFNYNIYLDIKDNRSQGKLHKLEDILHNSVSIKKVQFVRSHECYLIQLADFIMGALNYYLRKENKVIAKNNLIKKIQKHTNIDLTETTPRSAEKFNLFYIDLK